MLDDGKAQQWGMRWQSHSGSSYTASTVRMDREMNDDAHLAPPPHPFLLIIWSGILFCGIELLTFRVELRSSPNSL